MTRLLLAVVLLLSGCSVPGTTRDTGCAPRDTKVMARYAITGYWITPDEDACRTRRSVEAAHRLGADTLITMGPRLEPRDVDAEGRLLRDGLPDPGYEGVRRGPEVVRVYSYEVREQVGPGLLQCPGRDRVQGNLHLLYVPTAGSSCAKGTYDLVVVRVADDGLGHLVREAAAYGMRVYAGLPAAPQDPAKPWIPDLAGPLNALTGQVLKDWRMRATGLAGVYQSFEMALKRRPANDPVLALYKAQHAVVAATAPGTTILVSPYLDARRGNGFPPGLVARGMAQLAAVGGGAPMIVAVQDGRGTGKAAVYTPEEADAPVDPGLVPVVGQVTNSQGYYAPTRDYFVAAARHVPPGVQLWMNLEVFEPSPEAGPCPRKDGPQRGRTTKARVDRQLAAAADQVVKVVSYAWDPYLTCGSDPLVAEITRNSRI
ncbi:DUF4434 domain-containing protein [Nonomuraea sp. NPDC050556]|uniref:DUF4434 domain-containing protein n=1 Tax=Nonomuraea sp. NPDC050556 TaxID=3364369 RepID=UPI0037897628